MAIEVRDVSKSFGTTPVLKNVSVDIASGSGVGAQAKA